MINYSQKSLLDFYHIEGTDIIGTADEFSTYMTWLRRQEHVFCDRYSINGAEPNSWIFDPYKNEQMQKLNFGSNDYLNLSRHPKVVQAAIEALQTYGAGATGAALAGGNSEIHVRLIKKLAEIKCSESAVVYPSGYGANQGGLQCLLKENDLAVIDQYAHASIADGCSRATTRIFKHNDANSLEKVLKLNLKEHHVTKVICVDGVYSMDGDIAPLQDIIEVARRFNCYVFVDDAHAIGVIGETGKGSCEYCGVVGKVDFAAGTLSKAVGSQGGYIAATGAMSEYLRVFSRAHMFSTGLAPASAAAALAALEIMTEDKERRLRLWENIRYLKQELSRRGFNTAKSETAIFPVIIGDTDKVLRIAKYLNNQQIITNHVVFPAVPIEQSRIRISIMQGHTKEQLDTLVYHLEEIARDLKVI